MKQIVLSIALVTCYLLPITTNGQEKTNNQTFNINSEKSDR
ncbi:MAG: hypothetical protein ACK4ON_02565 [Bacteroidia bacterium]